MFLAAAQGLLVKAKRKARIWGHPMPLEILVAQFAQAVRIVVKQSAERKIFVCLCVVNALVAAIVTRIPTTADCLERPRICRDLIERICFLQVLLHDSSAARR